VKASISENRFLLGAALLVFVMAFVSCKSAKSVVSGNVDPNLSTKKIIANHYKNQTDFRTLNGRVRIDYSDGSSEQSFNVGLRMKKDSVIWISATLGIVKAYITPEKVSFYNKLEGEYFEGDYGYLSDLLGVELDFDKVQNLLLGNAIYDLRKQKYGATVNGNQYELRPKKADELTKLLLLLEPKNFKAAAQFLAQPLEDRSLHVKYSYQKNAGRVFPENIHIQALNGGSANLISLEFKNLKVNESLNFPYKIPKGFKEIVLK
tara:strand:- start:154 stop:942 length:789 start_codon:yes stop_codon:yes gene_type:complete